MGLAFGFAESGFRPSPLALASIDRVAGKAYDSDAIRRLIETQGAVPNIPSKFNRRLKSCFSTTLYKGRNAVERTFCRLKGFRRIATRYDKLATNLLGAICLAAARLSSGFGPGRAPETATSVRTPSAPLPPSL